MADLKPLIINAPSQGIAQSPHVGFGNMRNLDIYSVPGVVKLNNKLANASTTAVTKRVKWIVRDPVTNTGQNVYAVDTAGDVYVSTNSGTTFADLGTQPTSGGAGQGMAIWKDYLFIARATAVDLYGPLSNTPAWRNSWAGLTMTTDSLWHPMLVSKLDGKLYIGSGRYIDSVAEVSGQNFAWDTGGTYTATAKALTLPEDYRVKSLAEQGNNLMVGTWQGSANAAAITENKIADIFPWNGSSATYGKPIIMNENGVNAMVNIGGYLYILAGIDGKIYKSNGVQAWVIGQIPLSVSDISNGKYLEPYPGAIVSYKSRLFFGISSASTDGMGVYSLLETSDGNILNMEHFVDTESTGGTNPLEIGALLGVTRDKLLVGYRDNATYRIAITKTATNIYDYTTDYSGYFESPLYTIGTNLNGRKFTEAEFLLVKELATSEGIQVSYRLNLTDSFIEIDAYTFAILGAITSHNTGSKGINTLKSDQIQFRVGLLGAATTTPEFKSLTLK